MQVKKALLEKNNIEKVLNFYGYANIVDKGDEIRCGLTIKTNPSSIAIYKNDNISAMDYGRNINGDIFTLIMEHKTISYSEIISDIKSLLGIEITYAVKEKNESVSRVFDDILFKKKEELKIYSEDTLDKYDKKWNLRFLKDGISIETQKKFEIMYDYETERIVIPHRNSEGELCGIIGRINSDLNITNKYYPLIAYPKGRAIFGYSQNYKNLYNAETIYIGESEKFVMQLDSMGYHNAIALSGSSITKEQSFLIAKLNPKKVVFCFDEGLEETVIYRCVNKFFMLTNKMNIETGILIDRNNKYLLKGSKDSPSDNGIYIWESLIKECYERI